MDFEDRHDRTEAELQAQLHDALRRVEAPVGFTDRVMARAAAQTRDRDWMRPAADQGQAAAKPGALLRFTRPAWRAAYAAAALLALTAGAVRVEHVREEHRRTEQAAAQFDQAMQVTSHALDHVSAKLEQANLGEIAKVIDTPSGDRR